MLFRSLTSSGTISSAAPYIVATLYNKTNGAVEVACINKMCIRDSRCTGFIDGDKANQENIMTLATQFE